MIITYQSGCNRSMTDYLMVRKTDSNESLSPSIKWLLIDWLYQGLSQIPENGNGKMMTPPEVHPHTHHVVTPGFVDRPRLSDGTAGQMDGEVGWWTTSKG